MIKLVVGVFLQLSCTLIVGMKTYRVIHYRRRSPPPLGTILFVPFPSVVPRCSHLLLSRIPSAATKSHCTAHSQKHHRRPAVRRSWGAPLPSNRKATQEEEATGVSDERAEVAATDDDLRSGAVR